MIADTELEKERPITNRAARPGNARRLLYADPAAALRRLVNLLRFCGLLLPALSLALTSGCVTASHRSSPDTTHHFNFASDTFAYANGLVWEYRYDEHGK